MIDFTQIDIHRDTDLRPYQKENKAKIYKFWESGRSVMLQMPTGTGKTRVFASIARDMHEWGVANKKAVKILFLAHRKELIDQISANLRRHNIQHGFIAAQSYEAKYHNIQVGSVPTLNRRLERWSEIKFDIIIVDEAHHILAASYKKILNEYPDAKVLGVTATPYRLNKEGFTEVFENIIISNPISEFISQNWLSDYEYYSIKPNSKTQWEIDNMKLGLDGDYLDSEMEEVLDKDVVRAKVIESYINLANGKKGIVYTVNQQHNKHICEQFNARGISAKAIDSKTDKEERDRIVQDFKRGIFSVLCNVNIFSEGFDCPDVEFIQLARPTKSLSMYLQQVGRGFRTAEGKSHIIFIDNVGLYNRFRLPSARRNWRRYFNGRYVDDSYDLEEIGTECDNHSVIWIEGDEDMDLVFSSHDTEQVRLTDFNQIDDYPVLIIKDKGRIFEFSELFDPYQINDTELTTNNLMMFDDRCSESIDEWTKFDGIHCIHYNYKLVTKESKVGIYNKKTNRLIFDCVYDEIELANYTGTAKVKIGNKYGVIDIIKESVILLPVYSDIEAIHNRQIKDIYIVKKNKYYGIVNRSGYKITDYCYDEIFYIQRESIGFFNAHHKSGVWHIILLDRHNRYITISKFGRKKENLVPGFYKQAQNNIYGVINRSSQLVLPFVYTDFIRCNYNKRIIAKLNKNAGTLLDFQMNIIGKESYSKIMELCENLFYVDDGCIDANGKKINDIKMNKVETVDVNGFYMFTMREDNRERWSAINNKGRWIEKTFEKKQDIITYLRNLNPFNEAVLFSSPEGLGKKPLKLSDDFEYDLEVGDKVYHEKYKVGIVAKYEPHNNDVKISIKFNIIGEKTFLLSKASLRLVLN